MSKKEVTTIDALFGSKTRVKLLHLFLNNPGKSFYVREITRLIDEQINSVRRELSNLLNVGVITSNSADNKLYYEINQRYDFYTPFRAIFAGEKITADSVVTSKVSASSDSSVAARKNEPKWYAAIRSLAGVRVAVAAGALVPGSASQVDLLIVGSSTAPQTKKLIENIEQTEGRTITFSVLSYDEFYYRLSVRDRFVAELFAHKHRVIEDVDSVLKTTEHS